jgi:cytochrome c oxidase subunit 1
VTEIAHVHGHDEHGADHAPKPPPTGWHRFTHPGWLRVLWVMPTFGFFWLGFTCLIRWAADWHPLWQSGPIVAVALVSFPLGFLLGIGGFDYWLYYMAGRPTKPDLHEGHGARSWKDYFRINPDHKVIGMQYLVTVVFFFVVGGMFALLFRAELARPGDQYFNPQTFNVLVSNHAALMIFLVVIPGFAALGNFVIPLMIGAADMAFPKLNALSFWLLPIAGTMSRPEAGRRPAGRATRRSARTSRWGRSSSTWPSSGPGRARS